jgi:RNA polymerase sigma-70 factor (ECF subfamily)
MDLESFYDEYAGKVYKFFYIKSLDKMTAEDLTSQTFIAFIEKANTVEVENYKTYLYGIMRLKWVTFLRDKYNASIAELENIEDFGSYTDGIVSSYESNKGMHSRLVQYVNKLPEKQRQVITMRLIDNMSVKEVASKLGHDKNYVKTTHQRGLKRLRELLANPYMEAES